MAALTEMEERCDATVEMLASRAALTDALTDELDSVACIRCGRRGWAALTDEQDDDLACGMAPAGDLDEQLDGLACIRCGRRGGTMAVAGVGPRGWLFAHPDCPNGGA